MSLLSSNSIRALAAATLLASLAPAVAVAARQKSGGRPDLAVHGLSIQTGSDSFKINARVLNVGNRVASPSSVSIALSDNTTLDADDVFMDTTRIGKTQPRGAKPLNLDVAFPDEAPSTADGTLWVLVCADPEELMKERREDNNCKSITINSTVLGFTGDDDWSDVDLDLGDDDSDGSVPAPPDDPPANN